jgi:CDP-glucose 4,6-dehydratase
MENLVTLELLQSHYRGKKIFITGNTGFKGSWLTDCFNELGAKVKGYALEPEYENSLFEILQPLHFSENIIADIRNIETLKTELISFEPDYIFHLAAQPLVRRSYKIPAETFEVNVVGTANLLESVIQLNKKCTIIIITTDKVYENKEKNVLYREEDLLGGYDPYSASKACTEIVVNSFRNSFFNIDKIDSHHKAIACARAGNVIGGGDWSTDRIMPDIIRSLQQKRIIEIRNPDSVRPWQHVLEPLIGYLQLGGLLNKNPEKYSKSYNFGPLAKDHLPVREFAEIAISSWGDGKWKNTSDQNQLHEAGLLMLDITRAKDELHWHPKLSASKSIEWAINWYMQPKENKSAYTFQQIKDYLSL